MNPFINAWTAAAIFPAHPWRWKTSRSDSTVTEEADFLASSQRRNGRREAAPSRE